MQELLNVAIYHSEGSRYVLTETEFKKKTVRTWECRAILGGIKDPLCWNVKSSSLQILRNDRERMMDDVENAHDPICGFVMWQHSSKNTCLL